MCSRARLRARIGALQALLEHHVLTAESCGLHMLVVSLDALVCGLKLPRALRGFVQQAVAADGSSLMPRLCQRQSWLAARAPIVRLPLVWHSDTSVHGGIGASAEPQSVGQTWSLTGTFGLRCFQIGNVQSAAAVRKGAHSAANACRALPGLTTMLQASLAYSN